MRKRIPTTMRKMGTMKKNLWLSFVVFLFPCPVITLRASITWGARFSDIHSQTWASGFHRRESPLIPYSQLISLWTIMRAMGSMPPPAPPPSPPV